MEIITTERVHEIFHVDAQNGRLFWRKEMKFHPRLNGVEAGCRRSDRTGKEYWVVKVGRTAHKRSRLIFLAVNGRLPTPCVDHVNGNSLDDRAENLREATTLQNAWNHKKRRRTVSLPMGVRYARNMVTYQARISFKGTLIHLGTFATAEAASAAYQAKRQELYREWA